MLKSRLIRIVLGVILLTSLVAIFLSYRSRSDRRPDAPHGSTLLSPEVSRESTDFAYTQLKEGEPVFRVQAETSTLRKDGAQHLANVRLERFGPGGAVTDIIEGKAAEYQIDSGEIEIRSDVLMQLSDGTRIYAESAGADLNTEFVNIPGSFRFEQGDVEGRGSDLLYQSKERLLRIHGGILTHFAYPGGRGSSSAEKAVYDLPKRIIRLWQGAEIRAGDRNLQASQIRLQLGRDRQISEIVADNESSLRSPVGDFSGDRIVLSFPEEDEPARIAVIEKSTETPTGDFTQARFERGVEGERRLLSASRIDGVVEESSEGRSFLRSLAASGAVSLSAPDLDIERAESDHFRAEFGGQERIATLTLAGGVEVLRQMRTPFGLEEEHLEAPRLRIEFDETGGLDLSRAEGPASLRQTLPGRSRDLTADGGMGLDYAGGRLQSVVAEGDCLLSSRQDGEELTVRAPSVTADLSDEDFQTVEAGRGVEITYQVGGDLRRSESRSLHLEYRSGRLVAARQTGEVRLWNSSGDEKYELLSEESVYRPLGGVLEASGASRQPVLRSLGGEAGSFRALADRFEIAPQGNELVGIGNVQAVLQGASGQESAITARRMKAEPGSGWISFRGNPRLIQGENLIESDFLRINQKSRELTAEGSVESTLLDPDDGDRFYEVTAERLDLDPGSIARYAGEVILLSRELKLQAPELMVYFTSDEASVARIEAEGGVEIIEKGRQWNADRAVYYAAEDRVVVSR